MAVEVPTGITIKILKAVFDYMKAWFKLPFTIKKIEEKIEEKPLSKDAKFCPVCDSRMKVSWTDPILPRWTYHCETCNKFFMHVSK